MWEVCYLFFVGKLCMNGCVCLLVDAQNSDYTTGQVFDLSEKLEQSEAQLGRGSFMLGLDTHDRKSEDKLAKATRDRYIFIYNFLLLTNVCIIFGIIFTILSFFKPNLVYLEFN